MPAPAGIRAAGIRSAASRVKNEKGENEAMLVMIATGAALTGLGAVVLLASRRRRQARHRILQLAADIEAVALSIEADFVGSPANDGVQRLACRSQAIAQRARSALQKKTLLAVLPGQRLYAEEHQLHHDHGEIVHLRSRIDSCLGGLSQHAGRQAGAEPAEVAC
jgi:hypothetical protein